MEGRTKVRCRAMEPKGGTPERRWRIGIYGRISQRMDGRTIRNIVLKTTVQKRKKKNKV